MSDMKWLVSVGAGRWQAPGIRAARAAGLKVLAVDGDENACGFKMADRALIADIRDASAVIKAVERAGLRLDGAIAFCNEAGMLSTALLRERFNLPCARTSVTKALTNKGVQRARWTASGLPGPLWSVVRSAGEVPAALAKINGTAIFKPVDAAGSRGVAVVALGEPWESAFATALKGSYSGEVIIEAFIIGIEHTVETFTSRGVTHVLAITEKKKVPGTSNTVAYELATAQLDKRGYRDVGEIVTRALNALDYTDGPGHTEFLLTPDGQIFLVESAGRGGGFMVADGIVPQTSGFDMARACALQAVGLEPDAPKRIISRSVVLRFIPSQPGTVNEIAGFDAQDEINGVTSEPLVEIGQVVGRATSDGDRMAFILATAGTLDDALLKADMRERKIKITMA